MSSSIPTLKLEEINRNDSVLVDGQSQSDGPEDLRKVLTHFSALLVDQKELRVGALCLRYLQDPRRIELGVRGKVA